MEFGHIPVLMEETLIGLELKKGGIYLDCTLGGGGHSYEILKRIGVQGKLIAIDQDQEAITAAKNYLKEFQGRLKIYNINFCDLKEAVLDSGFEKIDGVLFDLGVSSYQLDNPERGFSYMHDAPLDMRMNSANSRTAYQLVNQMAAWELSQIIKDYGEERWAKRIGQFIVQEREKQKIETTGQLVDIIKKAIPAGARREGPHPAKRTFQALRIAVNDELGIIKNAVTQAVEVLKPGGRICVITFHSLEDRIVKETFKELNKDCICPPKLPVCQCNNKKKLKIVNKKPIIPSEKEINDNPRARSAKLRVGERI